MDTLDADPTSALSRRALLVGGGGLALLGLLDACTGGHRVVPPTGAAAASADQELIATLRQAVQASPDYLQRAAIEAVASKDVGKIVAFVRDRISVVPSWSAGDDPVSARRWGTAATLRGGSGTLRDRADLLTELLVAAGFDATVRSAARPSMIDLPTLYQVRAAAFRPDSALLAKAAHVVASPSPQAAPAGAVDPSPAALRAVAAALPTALQRAQTRTDLLPNAVPVVAVSGPSGTQYAFALGGLAPTGAAPAGLGGPVAAYATPQVTVTVSGVASPGAGSATPRGELIELVSGAWPAEEVFGRQVLLNFVPPTGAIGFVTGSDSDQFVRIPFLRIQTELSGYAAPVIPKFATPTTGGGLFATGDAITLAGDVLKGTSASGTTPVPTTGAYAGPFGPSVTLTPTQRKAAIAGVASVNVSVDAATYPEITLNVALQDRSGAAVSGLDSTALTVSENGKPVSSVSVLANAPGSTRPRVLIAYDTSGSVAENWPSAAAQARFEQSLASTLVEAAGEVPFDVQVSGLDPYLPSDAWSPPQQATLLTGFADARDDSAVWGTLAGDAIDQGATAIIMVSDFQALDDPSEVPGDQQRLAGAGIPVICLPIGKPDEATIAKIIALSGGIRLDPNAPATSSALAQLIKPLIAARTRNVYRIRYPAPSSGPAHRTVTVGVAGRAAPIGTATYTVPTNPAAPASFVGLYVRISVGGVTSSQRHLAGLPLLRGADPVGNLSDADAIAETRAAIFGLTTIAIEPGSVCIAALMDDLLASAQSVQPLAALPANVGVQQVLDTAGKKGVRRVPALLAMLLQPQPAQTDPQAVPTMRMAILQERNGATGIEQHMDLPPELNTIEPIGTGVPAFAAAMGLSVRAAVAEAVTFTDSAFDRLKGRSLTVLAAGDSAASSAFLQTVPAAQRGAWRTVLTNYAAVHVLAPTGAVAAAMWVVDPNTGATTAVLLDGSGGAVAAFVCPPPSNVDKLIVAMNTLLTLGNIVCVFAILPYFCLGVTVSSIAVFATSLLNAPVMTLAQLPSYLVGLPTGGGNFFVPVTPWGKAFALNILISSWLLSSESTLCLGGYT